MGKNRMPIELTRALSKVNGQSARVMSTSLTNDVIKGYYDLKTRRTTKTGHMGLTTSPSVQRRLRAVAKMLRMDKTDLIRGAVHATLPIMEKVAKNFVKSEKVEHACEACGR